MVSKNKNGDIKKPISFNITGVVKHLTDFRDDAVKTEGKPTGKYIIKENHNKREIR